MRVPTEKRKLSLVKQEATTNQLDNKEKKTKTTMTMATSSSDYTRCPFSYGMFVGTATVVALLLKHQGQKFFTQQHQESQESKTIMEEQEQMLQKEQEAHQHVLSSSVSLPPCEVVFVLGGPGAGKGTQCQLLQDRLGGNNNNSSNNDTTTTNNKNCTTWVHLSAGDLLRAERQAGGELCDLINSKISAGELVPSEITCRCLEKAMMGAWEERIQSGFTTKFLIDGFPRSHENMKAWEDTMNRHTIKFVLNFDCPEEVL